MWNKTFFLDLEVVVYKWFLLYRAGMYKYIGVDEKTSVQTRVPNNDLSLREFPRNLKSDAKTKKIFRFCNLPHEIAADTEGTFIQLFLYFCTKKKKYAIKNVIH